MAITPSRLTAERAAIEYTKRHARKYVIALLGDGAGNVDVSGRANWVWVRLEADNAQLTQAKVKSAIDRTENLAVMVERVLTNGATNYQVIGLAPVPDYPNSGWDGAVADHAEQHEIRDFGAGGKDKLNIYTRAHVELRARAQTTPDMTLYVEHGKYAMNGAEVFFTGGDSPGFTAPAAGYKRFDLLYFDDAGDLQIEQGTAVVSSLFTSPAYPSAPSGAYFPVAYVLLSGGQTTITETSIADARIAWGALGDGAMVSHNLLGVYHGDTLAAAVARGSLIVGNSTPKWSALALGAANKVLQSDGSDAKWSTNTLTLSGNSTINGSLVGNITGGGTLATGGFTLTISGNSTINGTAIVGAPGTLTVSTTNVATDPHTHAITASADVSAGTSALLKSASGALTLKTLTVTGGGDFTVNNSAGNKLAFADATNKIVRIGNMSGTPFADEYTRGNRMLCGDDAAGSNSFAMSSSSTKAMYFGIGVQSGGTYYIGRLSTNYDAGGRRDTSFASWENAYIVGTTDAASYNRLTYTNPSGTATTYLDVVNDGVVRIERPAGGSASLHPSLRLCDSYLNSGNIIGDVLFMNNGASATYAAIKGISASSYGSMTDAVISFETLVSSALVETMRISGGFLGVGTTAPSTRLHAVLNNATTNAVENLLTLGHNSTGTAAAGLGSGLLWTLESSTTADQTAALDEVLWTTATHASRTALRRNSTIGNAVTTGYYGHWSHSAVADTALTVIPNATGDVTELLTCMYTVAEVTGTDVGGGVAVLAPGESTVVCSDATNTLTLAVAADGSVTVQRTAGTDTFKVSLLMNWI